VTGTSIGPDDFRRVCGHFATGVTIITTIDAQRRPHGMTANSFASVSLDPPLISVAVDHAAAIFPALEAGAQFTVNILADSQEALSRRFAEGLDERFDGVAWHADGTGHVLLDAALAYLRCDKWGEIPAGDHTVFIGRVISGEVNGDGKPLLHYQGRYHAL
jgi:flavin reductase